MTFHQSANLVRRAESFAAICICTPTRLLHGCPRHAPGDAGTPESHYHMLIRIIEQQGEIMTALADLQAADAALKAEVATFLTDVSTALQNAASANDPAIEQVVSDINAEVAALQGADPVTGTAATAASGAASGTTAAPVTAGDSGTSESAS